jgi:hypothetical protein
MAKLAILEMATSKAAEGLIITEFSAMMEMFRRMDG